MNLDDEGPPIPVHNIDEARRARKQKPARPREEPEPCEYRVVRAADVTPRRIGWLWHGRIPHGMQTIIDADPAVGKSTLSMEIAARVSRGQRLPGHPILALDPEPLSVLVLNAEDSVDTTIVPRLMAAGADLDRVSIFDLARDLPDLDQHLGVIESEARKISAGLIIIDPLAAFVGRADNYRDSDIRKILQKTASLCDRTGAAILFVRHLTKLTGGKAIYRGGGSIGIIGAARVGLLAAKDPRDESKRILAVAKSNVSTDVPSLSFMLESAEVPIPGETEPLHLSRVVWLGESDISANDLAAAETAKPEDKTAHRAAMEAFPEVLGDRWVLSTAAEKQVRAASGAGRRTLTRVRGELKVQAKQAGGKWYLAMPGTHGPPMQPVVSGDAGDGVKL